MFSIFLICHRCLPIRFVFDELDVCVCSIFMTSSLFFVRLKVQAYQFYESGYKFWIWKYDLGKLFYFKILNQQTKLGNETGIELTSYVMLILSTIASSFRALLYSV